MAAGSVMEYDAKPGSYFEGCRVDYVDELPDNPEAAVLEIGCARGNTGALALDRRKCCRYVGIELSPDVAEEARSKLTEVITGNIETLELPFAPQSFDALIISEVLEHLVDPWAVMRSLAPLVKPGGLVLASSPNISQYKVIVRLVQGRWELTDRGVMDRTHLRWFTPALFTELFEQAGFSVEEVRPVVPFAPRTRVINWLTAQRFRHLFMRQISIRGRRRADG